MSPHRIGVIGISGSGKSALARKLATKTGLPLFHMDQLFWKGNWEATPEPKYLERHKELIGKERWIIEGYVDEPMADRLQSADLVLYLDYPGYVCAWRAIKRWLMHRRTARPELPEDARERLEFPFVWMVFNRGERPGIERALIKATPAHLVRLHSPREAESVQAQASVCPSPKFAR